jgi:tetratricopeptide (TPR) repeat protein
VQIQNLCSEGDGLAEDENYAAAIEKYWAAWDLLPKPQQSWEAATWILGAIGDANYLNDDFAAGKDNLSVAITCPDGLGNPFLHFRLGQCLYELSELDRAADELARAYMVAGLELFENEDPKYLAFLKTRLKPPPSGW